MINVAQIFLLTLTVIMMIMDIVRHRQRKIGRRAFLLWLFLWTGASVVILFPNSTAVLAHRLGIGRGADLVLYISVVLILYLLFKVYVRMEKVDREITQIVRTLALRQAGLGHGEEAEGDRAFKPLDLKSSIKDHL